jgi:hypothetical protein
MVYCFTFCFQAVGGDDSFAGLAAALAGADLLTFFQDSRTAGTMDGSVDTTASKQGSIGGVDDSVDLDFGDVALKQYYPGIHRI